MDKISNKDIKRYKKNFEFSYTLGVFPTVELMKYKKECTAKIFVSEKGLENEGVQKLINSAEKEGIPCEISDKVINRISSKDNCYAAGVFFKYEDRLSEGNHLVLVNPSDMGNLGTIIRTSLGFGIRNIAIISPGVDKFDPKSVRASMGALFKMNIEYFDSYEDYEERFPENKKYSFMLRGQKYLSETEIPKENFSLIFGNESSGLDDEYFEKVSEGIKIKQTEDIDSLNLAISVGISLYEFTKNTF